MKRFTEYIYREWIGPYIDCQVDLQTVQPVTFIRNDEKSTEKGLDTAVVIGGSIAGLTTASILSKYFKKVYLVDKASIPEGFESYVKHTHGEQPHAIPNRFYEIIDRLYPGFSAKDILGKLHELYRLNSEVEPNCSLKYMFKGLRVSDSTHIKRRSCVMVSRGFVEAQFRNRVMKEAKNIVFLNGYTLSSSDIELKAEIEKGSKQAVRVSGVTLRTLDCGCLKHLPCDLLVNCAGNGSLPLIHSIEQKIKSDILKTHNKEHIVTKSMIECKVRYQTIFFEPKEEAYDEHGNVVIHCVGNTREELTEKRQSGDPYKMVYHFLVYPRQKGILILPYDNNQFMITLTSAFDSHDRSEKLLLKDIDTTNAKEKIMEYFQDMPEIVSDLEVVLPKFKDQAVRVLPPFDKLGNVIYHYENLNHVSGFVTIGDAVASLNPIYGQGLCLAAEAVLVFEKHIREALSENSDQYLWSSSFCNKFQTNLYKSYFVPWILATSGDLMYDFSKYSNDMSWHKLLSPFLFFLNGKMFQAANRYSWGTEYLLRVVLTEYGYRKALFDMKWLLLYVLWDETKMFLVGLGAISCLCSLYQYF